MLENKLVKTEEGMKNKKRQRGCRNPNLAILPDLYSISLAWNVKDDFHEEFNAKFALGDDFGKKGLLDRQKTQNDPTFVDFSKVVEAVDSASSHSTYK
jgi:hypothetical protein